MRVARGLGPQGPGPTTSSTDWVLGWLACPIRSPRSYCVHAHVVTRHCEHLLLRSAKRIVRTRGDEGRTRPLARVIGGCPAVRRCPSSQSPALPHASGVSGSRVGPRRYDMVTPDVCGTSKYLRPEPPHLHLHQWPGVSFTTTDKLHLSPSLSHRRSPFSRQRFASS